MSNSLQLHGLQHARLLCPSLFFGVSSYSCPLSRWCHPTISSSVTPFSSCPHSFPVRVFSSELALRIRQPKYWSFSFSSNPFSEYSGLISFRIDWFDLLALQGTLKSLLQHHSSKVSIFSSSELYGSTLTCIHDYWKNHSFDYMDLCWQSDVSAFEYTVQVCHSFSFSIAFSFLFKIPFVNLQVRKLPSNLKVLHLVSDRARISIFLIIPVSLLLTAVPCCSLEERKA